MRRLNLIPVLGATLLMLYPSVGFSQQSVSELPLEECEFRTVLDLMSFESIKKNAAIAEHSIKTTDTISRIIGKANSPNKPIINQLPPEDIAELSKHNQRLQINQVMSMIEGRREMDLKVIERMVIISDRYYRFGEAPNEQRGNDDHFIFTVLQFLQMAVPREEKKVAIPSNTVCSIDVALFQLQREPMRKLGEFDVSTSKQRIDALLRKYNVDNLRKAQLSKTDQIEVSRIRDGLERVRKEEQQAEIYQIIRLMTKASAMIYMSNWQDATFSGGEISQLGETLRAKQKAGELSDGELVAIMTWTKSINEKIKTDQQKAFDSIKQFQKR